MTIYTSKDFLEMLSRRDNSVRKTSERSESDFQHYALGSNGRNRVSLSRYDLIKYGEVKDE